MHLGSKASDRAWSAQVPDCRRSYSKSLGIVVDTTQNITGTAGVSGRRGQPAHGCVAAPAVANLSGTLASMLLIVLVALGISGCGGGSSPPPPGSPPADSPEASTAAPRPTSSFSPPGRHAEDEPGTGGERPPSRRVPREPLRPGGSTGGSVGNGESSARVAFWGKD